MVANIWTVDQDGNPVEVLGDVEDLFLFGKIQEMNPDDISPKMEEPREPEN